MTTETQKKVVLVIDDQLELRKEYRSVIESWGYRVIEAADGMSAYLLLEKNNDGLDLTVDAIVSDMRMPTSSGLWFCQAVNGAMESVPPTLVHSSDIHYHGDGVKLDNISYLEEVFDFVVETHQKKEGKYEYIKDFLERHTG